MEGIRTLFQHPFFKGIVEVQDTDYREKLEAIKIEQTRQHERIDKLLEAVLDGENEWMLCLKPKEKNNDG